MYKPDGRHLTIETQNYLRQQAIRLREQGKRVRDISDYLGVHRNTVSKWWWEYEYYGEQALVQQGRGRQVGEGRTLEAEAEATIQAAMQGHFPEEYGIESALWTRRAVQALIEQLCAVAMPIRTVGEYLKRWGYRPKKPVVQAYEQNPKAVAAWLHVTYPNIEQRAEQEGAEIEWGDESGVRSDDYGGRGYAPSGETPKTNTSKSHRERVNYIASVSNQGHVQFMLYGCTLTAQVFIEFLTRLLQRHQGRGKLFWIVDRHPVHQQPAVKQWLEQHSMQIELFYLPSYSPELNPVEYLNSEVKQGVHDKPPTRSLSQLKQRVMSQLRKVQKLATHVRNYFKHPLIAYAAL